MNSVLHIYLRLPEISNFLYSFDPSIITNSPCNKMIMTIVHKCLHCDKDETPIMDMEKFRMLLSSEYSNTFPFGEPGDAMSFLNYLIKLLGELDSTTLAKALQINYLFSSNFNEGAIDTEVKNSLVLNFQANNVIEVCEKVCMNSDDETPEEAFKSIVAGKFHLLQAACLKSSDINFKHNIRCVLQGNEISSSSELNLTSAPPKSICFYFDYKSYFRKLEDREINDEITFVTRPMFARILRESFDLSDIFNCSNNDTNSIMSGSCDNNDFNNYRCNLSYIVGYYGFHYMAFVRNGDIWYLCEDSK